MRNTLASVRQSLCGVLALWAYSGIFVWRRLPRHFVPRNDKIAVIASAARQSKKQYKKHISTPVLRFLHLANTGLSGTLNTTSNNYWSSSTYAADTTNAWNVNFNDGNVNWNNKTNSNYVRCVRG